MKLHIFRYDLRLFDDIRWTKKISLFPVGLIGYQAVTSPIVVKKTDHAKKLKGEEGKQFSSDLSLPQTACEVIGFSDPWFANRKFPIDMAGFAANVEFIASHPHQSMPYKVGYEEDYFLQSLNVSFSDFEPLSECCTKVYVWHTKTVSKKYKPCMRYSELEDTNLNPLMKNLENKGIVRMNSRRGQNVFTCTETNGCDTIQGRTAT